MQIGLVLSGGGVKGAAHIGVLKALQEENIKISSIAGTSSGSIVAALYACGYSPDQIYYIFKRYCKCITVYDKALPFKVIGTLFTGKINVKYLAKGDNFERIMRSFCIRKNKRNIEEIDIPIIIPAVDIVDGQIVYFTNVKDTKDRIIYDDTPDYIYNGDIAKIVRASISVPGVFEPKRIRNHILVDGGIRENSPVSALKKISKNDEKIAVIYFEKIENTRVPKNIIDTLVKSYDIMGHEINIWEINKADYKIDIESRSIGMLDMSKIDYMVSLGYRKMKRYIKENNLKD